jgi:hypothetical protein
MTVNLDLAALRRPRFAGVTLDPDLDSSGRPRFVRLVSA